MRSIEIRIPFHPRYRRVEITLQWAFGATLSRLSEHWSLALHLIFVSFYIPLLGCRDFGGEHPVWGFTVRAGTDWGFWSTWYLQWGRASKFVHMPWEWSWFRTSVVVPNGLGWVHELARPRVLDRQLPGGIGYVVLKQKLPHWQQVLPYEYRLSSGEVQNVTATVSVSEMEWRWRWFLWAPLPRKVKRYIDVEFSGELGERTGSWKGGCTGCSHELLPNETPEESLRRMERTRKF